MRYVASASGAAALKGNRTPLDLSGKLTKQRIMEEKRLLEAGFEEESSSNLYIRGGTGSIWADVFSKLKAMINFIADYVPKFVKGITDGFGLGIFQN